MKKTYLPLALLLLSPLALAQDDKHPTPNLNDPAYEPLKAFVGTWNLDVVAGPNKSTATETFELVCNGLFLKGVVNGTWDGKPFQGVSIWSYDPKAKTYVNVWADSSGPAATRSTGTYDPKTKTFALATQISPQGPSRGVLTWKDGDTVVDTTYAKGPDGKEAVVMEITHRRATGKQPSTAVASTPVSEGKAQAEKAVAAATATTLSAGHRELHKSVGTWSAVIHGTGQDGKPSEEKGNEFNSAVCDGLWMWSDFKATFGGQPFEGHGLVGYDPATKTYTNYWIDSMSPHITTLTGTFDEKTKTLTCSGKSIDASGAEASMTDTVAWKDEHTRVANFVIGSGEQAHKFSITYARVHQEGAHKIK